MIVIEGPDGSGKSTLALKLSTHYKTSVIHGGGPLKDRDDFVARCRDKGWLGTKLYIFDRVSYISEPVYAWLAGHEPLVSVNELHFWIEQVKPVIIFCCLDTSKEMVAGMVSSWKAHKTPEHIAKVTQEHSVITARYKELMSDIPHLNFNYNKDDIRNLITEINHRIL